MLPLDRIMAHKRRLGLGLALAQAMDLTSAALVSRAAHLPSSVRMLSVPASDTPITLEVGLKMQNVDKLESLLRDVSDPASRSYGNHLTAAEAYDRFQPAEESRAAVKAWLSEHGVGDVEDRGFFVNFATTVEKANELLNSSFSYYDVQGTRKLRTREYSLADDIAQHIDLVTPTTYFGTTKTFAPVIVPAPQGESLGKLAIGDQRRNCSRLLTPPCLKEMYGFGDYEPDPDSGSRVAFASFLNQSAVPADLQEYLDMFDLPQTSWESVIINDGNDHQDWRAGVQEGNLDAQMMALTAKTLPMTHYVIGGSP